MAWRHNRGNIIKYKYKLLFLHSKWIQYELKIYFYTKWHRSGLAYTYLIGFEFKTNQVKPKIETWLNMVIFGDRFVIRVSLCCHEDCKLASSPWLHGLLSFIQWIRLLTSDFLLLRMLRTTSIPMPDLFRVSIQRKMKSEIIFIHIMTHKHELEWSWG